MRGFIVRNLLLGHESHLRSIRCLQHLQRATSSEEEEGKGSSQVSGQVELGTLWPSALTSSEVNRCTAKKTMKESKERHGLHVVKKGDLESEETSKTLEVTPHLKAHSSQCALRMGHQTHLPRAPLTSCPLAWGALFPEYFLISSYSSFNIQL